MVIKIRIYNSGIRSADMRKYSLLRDKYHKWEKEREPSICSLQASFYLLFLMQGYTAGQWLSILPTSVFWILYMFKNLWLKITFVIDFKLTFYKNFFPFLGGGVSIKRQAKKFSNKIFFTSSYEQWYIVHSSPIMNHKCIPKNGK